MTSLPENSSISPLETALVAALIGAGGCGAVVWAGAVGSSRLIGRTLPVDLADAVRALPKLVVEPGDPAGAWPDEAQSAVAAPLVYWSCTVFVAAVVAGVALVAWRWWRGRANGRRRLGVDAHARFATRSELRPLLIPGPVPGRFVFGRWGNRLVATENRRWAPQTPRPGPTIGRPSDGRVVVGSGG